MKNDYSGYVTILRKYKSTEWKSVYNAALRLDSIESLGSQYDKEIINGLEYSLLEGTQDNTMSHDQQMILYKKLLARYFNFGYKYHENIKDILNEVQKEMYVPEWYWYFKVKYSFESANRTINRKVKYFKESLEEYYVNEGQRPKNLYVKFEEFLSELKLRSVDNIEYNMEKEMEISASLKKTFRKYRIKKVIKEPVAPKQNIQYINIDKKILLIGACSLNESLIKSMFKEYGIDPNNVDLITEFDTNNFDFNTLKNTTRYSHVILGPTPHSVKGVQGYNNISQRMKIEDGFPEVIDVRKDQQLSKESIRKAVEELKQQIL